MESSGSRASTPASSDLSKVTPTRILSHFVPPQKQEPDGLVGKLAVGARWIWKEKSGAFNSQTSDTGKFLLSPRRELVMMAGVSVLV